MTAFDTRHLSPKTYARLGGAFYLVIIGLGLFGEVFVRGQLVVSGNADATAANISSHQTLWRLGIAGDLVMHICDLPLMWIFYLLFRSVNRNLALLGLLFNLIQTAVLAANKLSLVMALILVQKPGLAYAYIRMHGYGFSVGLIFFGVACLIYGRLIIRSGFLPRTIGGLLQLAGACYLVSSFTTLVWPAVANNLEPYILLPPFIAELSLCLWLLIKGIDKPHWSGETK